MSVAYRPPAPTGSCSFLEPIPKHHVLLENVNDSTRSPGPGRLFQAVPILKARIQDCKFLAASQMPTRTALPLL